jgi:hypothetical protein
MTTPEHDTIVDAFERRLSTVERLIPARPPSLGADVPAASDRPRINVVGGTTVRRRETPRSTGSRRVALGAIAAAVLVVVVVGMGVVNGPSTGPGGIKSPIPSAYPSATPNPAALCAVQSVAASPRPLADGCRYRSSAFGPGVTFQVGAGWTPVIDTSAQVSIRTDLSAAPNPVVGTLTIATIDDVSVTPCMPTGSAGPTRPWTPASDGSAPKALMDWIESTSQVPHSPPSPVTIDGHAGLETTLSPGIGSLGACGGVIVLSNLGTPGHDLRIHENEAMRLIAIVVGGRNVVIVLDAPRAALLGDLEARADPIIGSITFP